MSQAACRKSRPAPKYREAYYFLQRRTLLEHAGKVFRSGRLKLSCRLLVIGRNSIFATRSPRKRLSVLCSWSIGLRASGTLFCSRIENWSILPRVEGAFE